MPITKSAKKTPAPKKKSPGRTVVAVSPVPFSSTTSKRASVPAPKKTVAPASKVGASSSSVKKKVAPKKTAITAVTPKKKISKKPTVTETTKVRQTREFDEHGFVIGSDSSVICAALLEGGESRGDVNAGIEKALASATRYGNSKNVSSLVSGMLSRLRDRGYTIESTWCLVAPDAAKPKGRSTPAASKPSKTPVKAKKVASTRRRVKA